MSDFYVKIHETGNEKMVAIADKDLLGFKHERFSVEKEFYGDILHTEQEMLEKTKGFTILNIVGEKSINILKEKEIVEEDKVLIVKGVPHAQVIKV